ncbi:hypothetical protein SSPIM334S_07244 [Streptomyces spiroverticillatus]
MERVQISVAANADRTRTPGKAASASLMSAGGGAVAPVRMSRRARGAAAPCRISATRTFSRTGTATTYSTPALSRSSRKAA